MRESGIEKKQQPVQQLGQPDHIRSNRDEIQEWIAKRKIWPSRPRLSRKSQNESFDERETVLRDLITSYRQNQKAELEGQQMMKAQFEGQQMVPPEKNTQRDKKEERTLDPSAIAKFEEFNNRRLSILTRNAEIGNLNYQRLLGLYCLHGTDGVTLDHAAARKWLKPPADAGCMESCYFLGMLLANGLGGEEDLKTARHYLSQAADSGHADARCELGRILYTSEPGTTSEWRARRLLMQAAEKNSLEAHLHMALCCVQSGATQEEASVWMARYHQLTQDKARHPIKFKKNPPTSTISRTSKGVTVDRRRRSFPPTSQCQPKTTQTQTNSCLRG